MLKVVEAYVKEGEFEIEKSKSLINVSSSNNWKNTSNSIEVKDGDIIEIRSNPVIMMLYAIFAIFLVGGRFLAIKYGHEYVDYKKIIDISHIAISIFLLLVIYIAKKKSNYIWIKNIINR